MPKVTMTKRFYLGSASVVNGNNLCTLSEATEKGVSAIESGDEERYVVEVVRIIRRAQQPIIIQDVRK